MRCWNPDGQQWRDKTTTVRDAWSDGVEVLFDGGTPERTRSPTGKHIARNFGANHQLLSEQHSYAGPTGRSTVAITMNFEAGHKTSELYIQNGRLVPRDVYEPRSGEICRYACRRRHRRR